MWDKIKKIDALQNKEINIIIIVNLLILLNSRIFFPLGETTFTRDNSGLSRSRGPIHYLKEHYQYLKPNEINIYLSDDGTAQVKYDITFIKKNIRENPNNFIYIPKNNTPLNYFSENILIYNNKKKNILNKDFYTIEELKDCYQIKFINSSEKNMNLKLEIKFKNTINKTEKNLHTLELELIKDEEEAKRYVMNKFPVNIYFKNNYMYLKSVLTVGGSFAGKLKRIDNEHWKLNVQVVNAEYELSYDKLSSDVFKTDNILMLKNYSSFPFVYMELSSGIYNSEEKLPSTEFKFIENKLKTSMKYYYNYYFHLILYVFVEVLCVNGIVLFHFYKKSVDD